MTKYIIIWGVSGMNSLDYTVEDLDTKEQADNWGYESALEERQSLDGIHGYASCEDMDEDEYNEECENDLDYYSFLWTPEREKYCKSGIDSNTIGDWKD
jgi:hypothetical protein